MLDHAHIKVGERAVDAVHDPLQKFFLGLFDRIHLQFCHRFTQFSHGFHRRESFAHFRLSLHPLNQFILGLILALQVFYGLLERLVGVFPRLIGSLESFD